MAERVGFEPTVPLQARRISSAVQSTTLPPLRSPAVGYIYICRPGKSAEPNRTARPLQWGVVGKFTAKISEIALTSQGPGEGKCVNAAARGGENRI